MGGLCVANTKERECQVKAAHSVGCRRSRGTCRQRLTQWQSQGGGPSVWVSPRTSFPVHISLGFLCVWRLPLRPLERLTCAEQRVSVLAVSTALSYYSDAYTAADGVPEGFSDEDLVMALLRGAPLAPSRPLVATTFMFQRKEGEVLIAHGALNCVSPEARQDEEAQKADIFLLISVAKS